MSFGINIATAMCGCLAGKRRKILMKEFCDIFSDLIERSGIKQKEIAEILDVKAPYLSKLKSGKLLPPDFSVVQKISDRLNLDDDETEELVKAYKKSKFGESYIKLEKAISKMFSADIYADSEKVTYEKPFIKKENGVIEEKSETEKYMVKVLKGKNPKIFYDPRNSEVKKVLENSLSEINGRIKCFFFINNNKCNDYININAEILAGVLPLIMKNKIDFRYSARDFSNNNINAQFPYCVSNCNEQLFLSEDLKKSIYITEPDIVELCNNNYERTYDSLSELCLYFDDPVDFMKTINCTKIMDNNSFKETDIISIGYYPCVTLGARFDEMTRYVGNYDKKDVLLDSYEKVLNNIYSRCRKLNCLCLSEGVKEFLHNDEYVLFNESMSKNLPKQFRHKVLSRVLDVCCQSPKINYRVIKSKTTNFLKNFEAEIFSDGKLLIFYMMDNEVKSIIFNNEEFIHPIVSYYKSLADMNVICSNEESCNFMKDEMKKAALK